MSTVNSIENKARFFALYYGQKVLHIDKYHQQGYYGHMLGGLIPVGCSKNQHSYLSLRSISSLTDEEVKEVAKIRYPTLPEHDPRLLKWGIIIIGFVIDGIGHLEEMSFDKILSIADYLRSIGILIPWMDLSVETILSYGWAKEVAV